VSFDSHVVEGESFLGEETGSGDLKRIATTTARVECGTTVSCFHG
jgi:hypothetical protein